MGLPRPSWLLLGTQPLTTASEQIQFVTKFGPPLFAVQLAVGPVHVAVIGLTAPASSWTLFALYTGVQISRPLLNVALVTLENVPARGDPLVMIVSTVPTGTEMLPFVIPAVLVRSSELPPLNVRAPVTVVRPK